MNLICDTSVTWVIVFSHGVHGRSGMLTSGVFFYYLIMFAENPLARVSFFTTMGSFTCLKPFEESISALWYVLGPVYQVTESSGGHPAIKVLGLSYFLSSPLFHSKTVDSWLIPPLLPLLATFFLDANQVTPATHFSLEAQNLDLDSHASNDLIISQIPIQPSLCMNIARLWKRISS